MKLSISQVLAPPPCVHLSNVQDGEFKINFIELTVHFEPLYFLVLREG